MDKTRQVEEARKAQTATITKIQQKDNTTG